jgi:predicted nuclease of predicted toxin-antitoxin system
MRFLLDENVSYRVCPHLKAAGHDAVHVAEIGLTSADDQLFSAMPATRTGCWSPVITISCSCFSPPETPSPR